jgi:hypothetical protein
MPRPSNPAARLVLDGQRTCLANQSIGGQIHTAIFASKIQSTVAPTACDQPPASRKALQTIDNHITESLKPARFLPNAA